MSPEISAGDYALFVQDMQFENGKIYAVVAYDSEATLKKVYKTDGGWTLIPLNPKFQTMFVPDDKMIKMYKLVEVVRTY